VQPPPELLVLPRGATLGDFMAAATAAFRDLYRMCAPDFVANTIVAGLRAPGAGAGAPPAWDPAAPLAALLPPPPPPPPPSGSSAAQVAAALVASVPTVTVAGSGLDVSPCWLHAGGPEDWIVACTCGTRDDDGEAMVECDRCRMWFHTRCAQVPDDGAAFVCAGCVKRQRSAA
jgi:hypothetical protein